MILFKMDSDTDGEISVKITLGDMTADKDVGAPKHFEEIAKNPDLIPPWLRGLQTDELKELADFETANEARMKKIMKDKTYQFVCLLAGFTNQDMHQFWNADETEITTVRTSDGKIKPEIMTTSGRRGISDNDGDEPEDDEEDYLKKENQLKLHNWYQNNDFACPSVYLTPMAYSHIEEAITALTQRYRHLEEATLQHFMESPKVRCLFARLVAMCIRMSDVLSGKQYQLDSNYRRINYERTRLMSTFKNIQLEGNKLVFKKQRRYTRVGESTAIHVARVPSATIPRNWYNRNGLKMYLN